MDVDGTPDDLPPVALAWGGLRASLHLQRAALTSVIDRAGEIYGAIRRASRADAAHDFCLFCIAKGARLTGALALLQDALISEECYPLARTLYEHYLAMAAVQGDLSFLDEFLIKPLGLRAGTIRHGTSKRGQPNYREMIHEESGLKLKGLRPSGAWARATGWATDSPLHAPVYGFLSDHAHPNMVASDDMRNEAQNRFVYDSHLGLLQAAFWSAWAGDLLVQAATYLEEARMAAAAELASAHASADLALRETIGLLTPTPRLAALPSLLTDRLEDIRDLDPAAWNGSE